MKNENSMLVRSLLLLMVGGAMRSTFGRLLPMGKNGAWAFA